MNINDKKAVKSGFWYSVSDFVTKGATLITTPVFARLLSKEDMGVSTNITAWLLVLLPVLSFEYYTSIALARFDYKNELDRYCSSVAVYGSLITLFFYLIAVVFKDSVCGFLEVNEAQLHIMFLYMLFFPALSIFQMQNNAFYRYKASTAISFCSLFLSSAMSILFVIAAKSDKATAYILANRGTDILISLAIYAFLLKKGGGVSFKYFKYATAISFPLIWHTLSMHLLSSSDRIIIKKFIGAEAAALYAITYTSAHVISVLYHAIDKAWSPWALVQIHEDNYKKHKEASRILAILFFFVMIGLLLISPEILLIMGGKKYMEALNVIPPALLAVCPQMVYSLFINSEQYLKKQNYVAVGTICATFLNLILNIMFIPKYGYAAAAYTTFVGYFCLYLFHFFITMKLGMKRFYDSKLYFLIVVASIVLIPAFIWLYGHPILRYCVLAAYAVALLVAAYLLRERIFTVLGAFFKKKQRTE